MHVPRLLVLALLISVCVATVAAQSSPDLSPGSSQPVPTLPQKTEASTSLYRFQLPFDVDGLDVSHTARPMQREKDSWLPPPLNSRMEHILTLEQNEATCYTLRTYRVARETPDSDSTRPAGYSTCQRATRFQLRTAVDTREIAPR
jgi:hypothetical protein